MSFAGFQGQEATDFDWGWMEMDPPAAGWQSLPGSPAEAATGGYERSSSPRETDPDVDAFEAMQERSRTTEVQRQLEDAADLAGADAVDIKGESDAAIGADGKKIQNYIEENEGIVSRQLDLGGNYVEQQEQFVSRQLDLGETGISEVSAGMPSYAIDRGIGYDERSDWDDDPDFEDLDEKASEPPELGDTPLERKVVPLDDETVEVEPELGDESSGVSTEPYEVGEAVAMQERPGFVSRVKGLFTSKKGELEQPLLSESTEMTRLGSNMHLKDQPSQSELSPELSPEVRAGLNMVIKDAQDGGMSNTAIAEEFSMGLSSAESKAAGAVAAGAAESKAAGAVAAGAEMWVSKMSMKNYLLKQGKGLMAMPVVIPLVMWLNSEEDGLGDFVSAGMIGADMIATGDPLGVIVYAVGQLWDAAAKSRAEVIANDTPDKDYGARLAYVREGDTWYPAIYNNKYHSTGAQILGLTGGDDAQMTLDYGEQVVWRFDGNGNMVPMIPAAKSKQFVTYDDEWDRDATYGNQEGSTTLGGKGFVSGETANSGTKMNDTTRDWYWLTTEETQQVARGESQLGSYEDDVTTWNPVARQVNDWRKALDVSQDWKWSSAVQTMGQGAGVNSYEGSRGLQRITYEAAKDGPGGLRLADTEDYDEYVKQAATQPGDHSTKDTYSDYIFEKVIKDHIKTLYSAQHRAAQEAGFDKLYVNKPLTLLESGVGEDTGIIHQDLDPSAFRNGTVWSAMYLDTAKDMPVAASAEELSQQMHEIELLNDRTPAQRNYLSQKVQTRYWMQQAVQMGESTKLLEYMGGRNVSQEDPYDMKQYTAPATAEYLAMMAQDPSEEDPDKVVTDYFRESQGAYLESLETLPGFAMPWQNAGENWLPTLTGSLQGTSAKDYMLEYEANAYDRLGQSAQENTTKWINATGKFDPNKRIEGIDAEMQEGGLYAVHTADAAKAVTFEDETQQSAQFNVMPPDPTAMRGDSATGSVGPDTAYIKDLREKVRSFADAPATHRLDGENNNDWIDRIKDILEQQLHQRKDAIEEEQTRGHNRKFFKHQDALIEEEAKEAARQERWKKRDEEYSIADHRKQWIDMWKYNWSVTENEDAIKKWQETGKSLGVLDPDYDAFQAEGTLKDPDVPDPYANSHVSDTTVATHGVHTPMSHSIEHEEYNLPPMTSAYMAAIHEAEAQTPYTGTRDFSAARTVKVI